MMNETEQGTVNDPVIVMLTLQFKPGTAAMVMERLVPSILLTRKEPGNIDFQFLEVKGSADKFVVFERWKNRAALELHWKQPYAMDALQLFQEQLVAPLSEAEDVMYLRDVMETEV